MVSSRYHNEYKHNEISTSSQGKLILMMYEGAAKFTKMALNCMDEGDIADVRGQGLGQIGIVYLQDAICLSPDSNLR